MQTSPEICYLPESLRVFLLALFGWQITLIWLGLRWSFSGLRAFSAKTGPVSGNLLNRFSEKSPSSVIRYFCSQEVRTQISVSLYQNKPHFYLPLEDMVDSSTSYFWCLPESILNRLPSIPQLPLKILAEEWCVLLIFFISFILIAQSLCTSYRIRLYSKRGQTLLTMGLESGKANK